MERNKVSELENTSPPQQQQLAVERTSRVTDDGLNSNSSNNANLSQSEEDLPPVDNAISGSSLANENSSSAGEPMAVIKEECSAQISASNNATKNNQEMDNIREYDVLMGRGSGPNRHSGNIHFRAIVGDVFDDFLSKHGCDRSMISEGGKDMLRIDPSTKNRLAQTVLDKITVEKKGRFLQKLNNRELLEAIEKGEDGKLIKARPLSIMDAAMATAAAAAATYKDNSSTDEKGDAGEPGEPGLSINAVVYYKIIPEKQILAKIKQTFRFLRDQNEASNAEKHRLRDRQIAAVVAAASCGMAGDPQYIAASSMGGVASLQIPGGISSSSSLAATYALMERMGATVGMNRPLNPALNNINPSPLPDQLNSSNANMGKSVNSSSNGSLWAAARSLNNIMVPPTSTMAMNAIKNLSQTNVNRNRMNYSTAASRLLCDLPQPRRILSSSDPTGATSQLQAAAASQLDNNNKIGASIDNSTQRLLEELTLSRLANLQKQREDTINAYLAMERSSGGTQGSGVIMNAAPGVKPSAISSHQIQRLLSLNAVSPNPSLSMAPAPPAGALGGITSSASEPLSLLLQLNNNKSSNNMNRSPGNHPFRSFNSSSF